MPREKIEKNILVVISKIIGFVRTKKNSWSQEKSVDEMMMMMMMMRRFSYSSL